MELAQKFEQVELGKLKAHPKNPRSGDVDVIGESMRRNGFFGAIVAQRSTGQILVGNHRWKAAKAQGKTHVPVAWVDVDDDHALRILLADNRTNDIAEYNDELLTGLLSELSATTGLEGTGYNQDDLSNLLSQLTAGTERYPSMPERLEVYEAGEIKQIVLYFAGEEYDALMPRLVTACAEAEVESNTELFLRMLEHFEKSTGITDNRLVAVVD